MELDKALESIKALANGINPLTGEVISGDTIINDINISRNLFNAYSIICEALSSKGVKRNEFRLTDEQAKLFIYSDESLKISEIADRLNALKDEKLRSIQAVKITNWLLSENYLEVNSSSFGKDSRLPTQKGKELGITTVIKQRDNGGEPYPINLYNKTAQKFIIDNLSKIIESNNPQTNGTIQI